MNKLLVPLVILLGSLLYSLFWNQVRKPECTSSNHESTESVVVEETVVAPVVEPDTTQLTETEKALFEPLDVYFLSGSPNINRTQEINDWLELAKKYLVENPNEKLSVTGHTDSDGSDELNQGLSIARAEKVKNLLVADGFAVGNLVVAGEGEKNPVADNATPEGKAKNRRVSIRLIK